MGKQKQFNFGIIRDTLVAFANTFYWLAFVLIFSYLGNSNSSAELISVGLLGIAIGLFVDFLYAKSLRRHSEEEVRFAHRMSVMSNAAMRAMVPFCVAPYCYDLLMSIDSVFYLWPVWLVYLVVIVLCFSLAMLIDICFVRAFEAAGVHYSAKYLLYFVGGSVVTVILPAVLFLSITWGNISWAPGSRWFAFAFVLFLGVLPTFAVLCYYEWRERTYGRRVDFAKEKSDEWRRETEEVERESRRRAAPYHAESEQEAMRIIAEEHKEKMTPAEVFGEVESDYIAQGYVMALPCDFVDSSYESDIEIE